MDVLLQLINDLLSLAEGRAHDLQQPLSAVDLMACLKASINDQLYTAQSKRISVNAQIIDRRLDMYATEEGLRRIFDNLISNAIKYTPEGGSISVTALHDAEAVRVSIWDTGIGIPQDALDKLGQEFFRAENAKDSGIVGTGLGLATVNQFIGVFGGHLQVQSALGEGTTFTVILPLAATGTVTAQQENVHEVQTA
jgi:signal transduction histidine kinase